MIEGCISECSEDVQAGFSFSVNVFSVLPERHTSVVGHSKRGGGVLVGNGCVVVTVGCVMYSLFQGVMSDSVDLMGETLSLFVWSHSSSV